MRAARLALLLSAMLTAGSAAAQSTDWDVRREPGSRLMVAFTAFDNGLAIGARCTAGTYEVAIAGLPKPSSELDRRPLRIGFNGGPLQDEVWFVAGNGETAISSLPAPFARTLREGGRMDVVVPGGGEGGRNIRYVVDLPPSGEAIDQTLTACGRPLEDSRDSQLDSVPEGGLQADIKWRSEPRVAFPLQGSGSGFVTVSCLTQATGAVRDCAIEAEYPARLGFGRAALRAMDDARLELADGSGGPLTVRLIVFTAVFYVDGFQPGARRQLPTGSRLPVASPDG